VARVTKDAVVVGHRRIAIDVGIAIPRRGPGWMSVRVPVALLRSACEAALRPMAVRVTGVTRRACVGVVSWLAGRVAGSVRPIVGITETPCG
jgi:hypothetical protein